MSREGLLTDLLVAGATVSEPTCGSCAGIGHVPAAGGRSLRAFNRNFSGRSGVKDDQVYLCSPLTAAASALTGVITDPRGRGRRPRATIPPRSPPRMPASCPVARGRGGSGHGGERAQYQGSAARPAG
jgi:aconitate hydratase